MWLFRHKQLNTNRLKLETYDIDVGVLCRSNDRYARSVGRLLTELDKRAKFPPLLTENL